MTQTFPPELEHVFQDCIELFGEDAQLDQVQEEALELALAVRKYKRAKKYGTSHDIETRKMELISETADVIIMTQQLRKMFPDNLIQAEIRRKLTRQQGRVRKKSFES